MFRTSVPAIAEAFLDRADAVARLEDVLRRLKAGSPQWLCILGPRKIGKTSLLLELSRRSVDEEVAFVVLDVFETMPISVEVLRLCALRAVDRVFARHLGLSTEALAGRPADYRRALQSAAPFASLPSDLRADLLDLPDRPMDDAWLRTCIDLPERLAHALKISILVAIDEFQELGAPLPGRPQRELLPLLRSAWQRHRRVAYVISGSARTMLTDLVTKEHSPFFQHFALMELGPFAREDALKLLTDNAADDRTIDRSLAERALSVLGGHPFYLQLFGETLTSLRPPYDEGSFKTAMQELLFSRTGRLALYFENELDRLAGRSTFLLATLQALADGPRRFQAVASAIQAPSGAVVRYLERLGDAVIRDKPGHYRLADPVFGLWLRWRQPGGTVVPMRVLGDEAEQRVAEHLALMGFELIYQSRASRGAFDLFATRGAEQLGVQVKRSGFPVRFTAPEWSRMEADGERMKWRWVVAAVAAPPGNGVVLLDPAKAKKTQAAARLDEAAAIENLLLWLDKKRKASKPRKKLGSSTSPAVRRA
ncbi:MAG: ATP-binding protein [Polyangiaceae bacterium]|nr:ATP-binding protein [Polyangiaceae bacterium]